MEIKKLIEHMRQEAKDYRAGRTLGRAFADAEDVLDEAASALEQLQKERGAAIRDISSILANIEEIRQEHVIDDADLDEGLANLCGFYCAINGHGCYKEGERYYCKNFKWRGKEDKLC